jgi:hypothetical protein
MADRQPESARAPASIRAARSPYLAPRLEFLGSLRSATRGTGAMGKDAGGTMTKMSDRRAKMEIVEIGRHPLGLGIYRFRYDPVHAELYGGRRQVGLMADEVAEKYPDAVSCSPDGFLMVDYGRLFH